MMQKELPPMIHDAQNGLDYILQGDYYIPMIGSPSAARSTGKWGQMHKQYLENYKPVLYNQLVLTGKLGTYLANINDQAQERLEVIIRQMMRNENVTEQLKATDQMQWIGRMNSIRQRAEEIVMADMIYA